MIDKAKLLQWIEDQIYVCDGPYSDEKEKLAYESALVVLRKLNLFIDQGWLDEEPS